MEKVITILNSKPLLLSYNNKKIHKIIIKNFIDKYSTRAWTRVNIDIIVRRDAIKILTK